MKRIVFILFALCLIGCSDSSDRFPESNIVTIKSNSNDGLHVLWNPEGFSTFDKVALMEEFVNKGGERLSYIDRGYLVPINTPSEPTINVEIRIGSRDNPASIPFEQESRVKLKSEEYLLISDGLILLSDMDHLSKKPAKTVKGVKVKPGRYAARVYYIQYPQEMRQGPAASAPFVVTLNPEPAPRDNYRRSLRTWDQSLGSVKAY